MGRKASSSLTDGELRIMRALWDLERATVSDVVARMQLLGERAPAYNSVLTLLGILERKGYVRHHKEGRAYLFQPTVNRDTVRRSALSSLVAKFFDGSPSALVLDLLGHEDVDAAELARVRALIDDHEAPQRATRRSRR